MKRNHYARKKRQLKFLAKKLNNLLIEANNSSSSEIDKIVLKIRLLVKDLSGVFSRMDFKNVLGAVAISLGIFYANDISAQSFEPPVANPFGLTATLDQAMPVFADLDGDGDLDLLVGEYYGVMKYFQNIGTATNPQFTGGVSNPFGLDSTYSFAAPTFADLDGDGDIDLLVGEYYGNMQYFENTGSATSPQFAVPVTNPFGLAATVEIALPEFADLDGDGDMDLLVGELYTGIQYFENVGTTTNPLFTTPVLNPFGLTAVDQFASPTIADLDNDGDLDLLVGEYNGSLQYFENTGSANNPQFATKIQTPFGLSSTYEFAMPAFADIDDDGDMDLLVGEYYGNMQYFKNNLITGIEDELIMVNLLVFPNPVSDVLNIKTDEPIKQIEVVNILGQSVLIIKNPTNQINFSDMKLGFYTLKVSYSSGGQSISKIQKL
tara:strand:- start:155761 stop:157065 length:1305 start_codon:yes stop_codon:yes gene_type:complete